MRVLIDALSARSGGGKTYMKYMPQALVAQASSVRFSVLLSLRYQSDLAQNLPDEVAIIDADLAPSPYMRWWYLKRQLPRLLSRGRFDLLFAVAESSYCRLPCPLVILARNLSIYTDPGSLGRDRLRSLVYRLVRQPLIIPSLGQAASVVFVSEAFRSEVCDKTGLPLSKTQVVYHGLSPFFRQTRRLGDSGFEPGYSFILSVSTINPHKNYDALIRAFAKVIDSHDLSMYHLVIVGGIGTPSTYKTLLRLTRELELGSRVHFLGEIEHRLLPAYYHAADLFVLPSRLESFGNPLVEAMATATPIVASNLPLCREICEDAAVYADTENHESLARHIEQLLRDSSMRQELAEKAVNRSRVFSWDRAANQMIQIFEQAAGR